MLDPKNLCILPCISGMAGHMIFGIGIKFLQSQSYNFQGIHWRSDPQSPLLLQMQVLLQMAHVQLEMGEPRAASGDSSRHSQVQSQNCPVLRPDTHLSGWFAPHTLS